MQAVQSTIPHPLPNRPAAQPIRYSQAFFQYTGTASLSVIGSATGTRYHFHSFGAIVAVDFRDLSSLASVPSLKRVNRP